MSHDIMNQPRELFPENPTLIAMSTALGLNGDMSLGATKRAETLHTLSVLYPEGAALFTGPEAISMHRYAKDHNLPVLGRGTYSNTTAATPIEVVVNNLDLLGGSRGIVAAESGPSFYELEILACLALGSISVEHLSPARQMSPRKTASDLLSLADTVRLIRGGADNIHKVALFKQEIYEARSQGKLSKLFS